MSGGGGGGSEGDSGQEKSHDASARKIEEARRRGDVPRSADSAAAAAYVGLLAVLLADGDRIMGRVLALLTLPLDRADALRLGPGFAALVREWSLAVLGALSPILLAPFGAALAAWLAQRAFAPSLQKLSPQLSRISPLAQAKQKFGAQGIVEFLKSTAKMTAIGVALWLILVDRVDEVVGSASAAPGAVAGLLGESFSAILIATCLIVIPIAAIDLIWQRLHHLQTLRMSHQDLRDENRESEGDPHQKSARRQRAQEIATNRMLTDIPKADVVIVNPTHYAVALRWDRSSGRAPVCVAKGVDEIALRIRAAAAEHGVPLHRDPPAARAIHATVEIGQEIETDHYRAVAAAIRFADDLRKRAGRRGE